MREEEPFRAGRGLGQGKSPGSSAEHPSFWVQGCNPTVCQDLETEKESSRWLRVMPTTVARRWTKAASVQRTWGGGWVQTARRHVSQGRVPGSTVKGGDAVLKKYLGCTGRLGVGQEGGGLRDFGRQR